MQVNNSFEAVVTRPSYGTLEIGKLAGDIGLSGPNLESPVSDGNADMVESRRRPHRQEQGTESIRMERTQQQRCWRGRFR